MDWMDWMHWMHWMHWRRKSKARWEKWVKSVFQVIVTLQYAQPPSVQAPDAKTELQAVSPLYFGPNWTACFQIPGPSALKANKLATVSSSLGLNTGPHHNDI
jgi:hypothetical protein